MVTIQTFAIWYLPGVFFSEEIRLPVESRDIEKLTPPKSAYAVRFFDRLSAVVENVELYGPEQNHSPTFYLAGTFYTTEQIQRIFPDRRTLLGNIVSNGWQGAVEYGGNFYPYQEDNYLCLPSVTRYES